MLADVEQTVDQRGTSQSSHADRRLSTNLIIYMTRVMHYSPAFASAQLTMFEGTAYLTPILGAWLADAAWGRYKTILVFSIIYMVVRHRFCPPPLWYWQMPVSTTGSFCPTWRHSRMLVSQQLLKWHAAGPQLPGGRRSAGEPDRGSAKPFQSAAVHRAARKGAG